MLSTSRIKLQNQYLLVALLILVLLISAIVVYQSGVLPTISAGQPATQNLSNLSAAEVSAYRWQAMADLYAAQQAQIPVTGGDLTTLSDADISTYRSDALARYYLSERETFTATQTSLDIYHQSERNAAPAPAFHSSPPGR